MERDIRTLSAIADALEPPVAERVAWLDQVRDRLAAWMGELDNLPTLVPDTPVAEKALAAAPIDAAGTPIDVLLDVLAEGVDAPGVNVPSPRFFGFIPSGALFPSALGDLYAATVGKYVGKSFGAQGAARLDRQVVEWLAGIVGYPADCGGDLTSGASMATLSAVITARQAAGIRGADVDQHVVYVTAQTHAAIGKALLMAGLNECIVSTVPVDDHFRMRPDALEAAIARHHESGLRPWLLVATAGTTDTGAVDPLADLAEIAERESLWFHVDAAYGGAFGLTDTGRQRLHGIERSQSVALDPHMGLSVPFGSGAVLVREATTMEAAFSVTGACLRDTDSVELASPSDFSGELTRPFRGLRLWLPLQLFGVEPFRAFLDLQLLLARHAHERLSTHPALAVNPEPDLSIVTWRVAPDGCTDAEADALTQAVVESIQAEGRIFLSSTIVDDRVTIRLAVLNHRVRLEHVDDAVDTIIRHTDAAIAGRRGVQQPATTTSRT